MNHIVLTLELTWFDDQTECGSDEAAEEVGGEDVSQRDPALL